MTSKIITANRQHSLRHILDLMEQNKVGRVVIADGEKPLGIVTAADVVFAQLETPEGGAPQQMVKFTRKAERASRPKYRYVKSVSITAENVMRPELFTIAADEDAAIAADIMLENSDGRPSCGGGRQTYWHNNQDGHNAKGRGDGRLK